MPVKNRKTGLDLGPRLESAVPLVRQGDRVADIGTDHAYLPIYLVLSGISPEALATDIARGPVERALDHIRQAGLSDRIRVLCTPGLDGVGPFLPDTVLIFGMGGDLIARILDRADWLAGVRPRLVLQPMTHAEQVRIWLSGHGYGVFREILSEENGKFYVTMGADPGNTEGELSESRKWLGRLVPDNPPGTVGRYLDGCVRTQSRIVAALKNAGRDCESEMKKLEILRDAQRSLGDPEAR